MDISNQIGDGTMDNILEDLSLGHLKEIFKDNKVGPHEVLSLRDEDFHALGIVEIGPKATLRQRCQVLVDGTMDNILEDLSLGHLKEIFKDNKVGPHEVLSLRDEDFHALGIVEIGPKATLRQRCQVLVDECVESPVINTLKMFQRRRRRGLDNWRAGNKSVKQTRRLYIGWKHKKEHKFDLVPVSKGGGQQNLDAKNEWSLEELEENILDIYFPHGFNAVQNFHRSQLDHYLASFSGNKLPERIEDQDFTLELFYNSRKSYPIRVYLHTSLKGELAIDDAENNNTERQECTTSEEHASMVDDTENNTTESEECTTSEEHASMVRTDLDYSDSDLYEPTDTPTINFRRRRSAILNRLRLRRMISTPVTETIPPPTPSPATEAEDGPPDLTLKGILQWWVARTVVEGDGSLIVLQRGNILKSTLRVVQRNNFNFCKPFSVTFSGEDGEDLGGPKREFLRLLLNDVQEECFHGDVSMFFTHDLEKLSCKKFEMAGSLVAFSILHGGPAFPILHNSVYDIITRGDCEDLTDINTCIMDIDQREKVQEISQAQNQEDYSTSLNNMSEWCSDQGLSVYSYRNIESRDQLIKIIIKNEIVYRVHSEIDQFKTGLNKVGALLDMIMLAPEEFRPLFTYSTKTLSFSSLRSMYKVMYSPEGSNYRMLEGNAIYCLEAFLADCEGGTIDISIQEVLAFWTGASSPPPLGFTKELEVTFGQTKRLPTAHTCGLILNIWRGYSNADDFAADMVKAIKWGGGFYLS